MEYGCEVEGCDKPPAEILDNFGHGQYYRYCAGHFAEKMYDTCIVPLCKENRKAGFYYYCEEHERRNRLNLCEVMGCPNNRFEFSKCRHHEAPDVLALIKQRDDFIAAHQNRGGCMLAAAVVLFPILAVAFVLLT